MTNPGSSIHTRDQKKGDGMQEYEVKNCKGCNEEIFLTKIGEKFFQFEDLQCKQPHTQLRCEINQVLETKLNRVEIELNKIKERLNLL